MIHYKKNKKIELKKHAALLLVSIGLFSMLISNASADGIPSQGTINICSEAGWPPYIDVNKNKQNQGYDVDVLKKVFKPNNVNYSIKMLPWKRCVHWTKHGKKYQIVSSAGSNDERQKNFLFTRDYYSITPSFFYSKARFPDGPGVKSIEDFKQLKVCGVLGFNYSNFLIPVEDIDTTAKNYTQIVEKMERKRCDVFLAQYEIFIAFSHKGDNYIENYNLTYEPIPGGTKDKYYFMISRKLEYANELKTLIDREINKLETQGELELLLENNINKLKS